MRPIIREQSTSLFGGDLVDVSALTPESESIGIDKGNIRDHVQLSCGNNLLRITPTPSDRFNYYETCTISNGLYLTVLNMDQEARFALSLDCSNLMGFCITFSAMGETPAGIIETKINTPLISMFYAPDGTTTNISPIKFSKSQGVIIYFHKDRIESALGISKTDLPKELMRFYNSARSSFLLQPVELPHSAIAAAHEALDAPVQSHLRYRELVTSANNILLDFIRALDAGRKPVDIYADRLQHARRLLTENLTSRYTLESLAREVGIGRTKLIEEFKQHFGITINEYQRDVRLNESYRLLSQTNHGIAFIAEETGFSSPNNFTTAFKKKFGVTPRELRKQKLEVIL
ncbi:helix-turn-helix transcriptional regulator [Pseudomaricurvus alkylphenolicus]|uniref:helix-turn-helix domain-containing protein n=1 Tax=Pseudomaricurvus alkylphenolicus TaxID=1306991 RepID=UPI0014231395|nr:AraC family transcriptional regulator [Pseudomaricurvus alkylphenolicus]NIB38204.1 helix-turn-helix transcriptional regulator [Pseudomaricurvus alkylphenolicus]